MSDFDYEARLLQLQIKENEDRYISGELTLDEPLRKTEELYDKAYEESYSKDKTSRKIEFSQTSNTTKFSRDSGLMQLQSKIVQKRTKIYKPDTLVFDPREFSEKLKRHYNCAVSDEERNNKRSSNQFYSILWQKLGEESQEKMHTAPTFDFLYGTFDAQPASPVKKKRRRIEKDKVANAVKPKTVDVKECSEEKDLMLDRATKILSILARYVSKTSKKAICFYEFVIDPHSFSRTIENIFLVTFLLRNGNVCIFSDEQGLPWIRDVKPEEKKERARDHKDNKQSVLSMSLEEWKAIIEKCKFKEAKIPPQKSKATQER
ncbi:EP300-interacting inhibitor of differentiation 3 isoform X2 [Parasteatoda tepidariorum]|nr:EP300-interacting inhibitor of differentiation 3 isoform X1 [Parasteatoda tepidariorum]XP_042895887.1 EP300-interacting inhibitor of differentiation 3 isoform X2 [Parasteatoda tepidariorum]